MAVLNSLKIAQPVSKMEGEEWVVSTTILIDEHSFDVWYRTKSGPLAEGVESFVVASLIPAMKLGYAIEAPGTIARSLFDGLLGYQRKMHEWYPDLQIIPIHVKTKSDEQPSHRGVGSFFSCGVDACYTFLSHYQEITTGILIHGFDYHEQHTLIKNTVSSLAVEAATRLNRPLIEVNTNIRTMGDLYTNWGKQYHGSVLASVALLLSPQLGKVYIPSSYHRDDLFPWGSHPEIDSLLGSDDTKIVHDSCDVTRSQKVSLVAQSDAALSVLRVCWTDYKKKGLAMNCGKCEKCIRTMVDLRIAGALERCHTFQHPLRLKKVARVDLRHGSHRSFYQGSLMNLQATGSDAALEKALTYCLSGHYYKGFKGKYRDMQKKAYREVLRPVIRPIERSIRKLVRKILLKG